MFKNKKVILSSIAIVFTLVVCSIFVNFTLANSGSPTAGSNAGSSTGVGLTGYSNIDLAVINSNDASLKATGDDKFRVVQILPKGLDTVVNAETALTKKVTAKGYSGDITKDSEWNNTSYLWRYIYGEEYFRLAVFNGYKTIKTQEMAQGAVQLTSVTVDSVNSMNTEAQGILSQADFVYIYAENANDYGSSAATDISEELYNWLDAYATADRHPLAICIKALCVDNPASITGNNDTRRMGALAYKLITKNSVSRYDNVLVTESDFFKMLYEEAEDGKETGDMPSTTKTISDFILYAERDATDGGANYIGLQSYYKWYSGMSMEEFFSGATTEATRYSRFDKVGGRKQGGITTDRKQWEYDNAKILVISENDTSAMFDTMKYINSNENCVAADYVYNEKAGKWQSVEKAPNSVLTKQMYDVNSRSRYVPSGADLYLLKSDKLQDAVDGTSSYDNISLSRSYYMDVEVTKIEGTIKVIPKTKEDNAIDFDGWKMYLIATDGDGVQHYVALDENQTPLTYDLDISNADYNEEEDTIVYKYAFKSLNPNYTYSAVIEPAGSNYSDYRIGRNGNDFVVDNAYEEDGTTETTNQDDFLYADSDDAICTYGDFDTKVQADVNHTEFSDEPLYEDMWFDPEDKQQIFDYVTKQHDIYANAQTKNSFDNFNFEDFDFIFIDAGKYSTEIGNEAFNKLCAAVEAGVYVIVSSAAGDGKGSQTGGGNSGSTSVIVNSPSAKAVADIINAGVYRDGADNKFRVLEIQPDYPIDTAVAESMGNKGSSYSKHSDGSDIKGDYYTVPSDVITGKAKEELPSLNTEYYQFDLTKAKIAYALKNMGVRYGDIELTQVSTEALIGMKEDIMATYDLVYIGGDISAMDRSYEEIYAYNPIGNGNGAKALSSTLPTFIMYTHTGFLQLVKTNSSILNLPVMATGLTNGNKNVYMPENGNDLTDKKYQELVDYVNSGRPVMISKELTSVYEKMKGYNVAGGGAAELSMVQLLSGYWYNDNGALERGNMFLDPSSRMYTLLGTIYGKKSNASVTWGFNPDDTQMIENIDGTYGDTLYTFNGSDGKSYLDTPETDLEGTQGWYSNGNNVIKKYAVVFSDLANDNLAASIKNSVTRTRLTLLSKPTKYVQGIQSTYIRNTTLSFTFTVSGGKSQYSYTLYVDKNKDTAFDVENDFHVDGTVGVNTEKTVSIALDPDFFGAASWYLEILDGETVVSTASGVSKIINTSSNKAEINVLQVQTMVQGQDANHEVANDTLYFDIGSQWAHKIMYYNGQMTNPDFNSNTDFVQKKELGRRDFRFGIVEYDHDKGDDDWFSNLADALSDDYDINLDIAVADTKHASFKVDGDSKAYDCLDTWSAEADILKAGGKVDGLTQAEYVEKSEEALIAYNTAKSNVDTPRNELNKYLKDIIAYLNKLEQGGAKENRFSFLNNFRIKPDSSAGRRELISLFEMAVDTEEYYMIFLKYFTGSDSVSGFGELTTKFEAYRDKKNLELDARDKYRTYLRRSYGDEFLRKMYSILVLGPSNDFGNFSIDLSKSSCAYISDYVSNGGDLFFFHDTMTPYYNNGAMNLTTELLDVVGMNRFHVDMTDQKKTYDVNEQFKITGYTNATPAGLVQGTLTEDGYIYYPETYGTTHDWQGPLNGWVQDKTYVIIDQWGNTQNRLCYKKEAKAGTSGYIWQDAKASEPIYSNEKIISYEYDPTNSGKSADIYYLTPYANNTDGTDTGIRETGSLTASMKNNLADSAYSNNNQTGDMNWTISAMSMSSMYYAMDKSMGDGKYLNYLYSCMDVNDAVRATTNGGNHEPSAFSQTAKVSQLNEGLVTLYPFSIGASLNVTGTHQQAYALDLENQNTKVWYTLAGTNNSKTKSSMYAASPYDAMESYFIYTTAYGQGAITYCGAGHTSVTGNKTKNNDERKLFINVIVNSAAAVVPKPSITVYEPDTNFKTEMAKDEEALASSGKTVYTTTVENKTDSPDFDFKVGIPNGIKLKTINVYYDLDYDDSDYSNRPSYNASGDVMIKQFTSAGGDFDNITTAVLAYIKNSSTNDKLKLQESYFQPYGGTYTYIVIEVYYDDKTTPVYVMIKVKASDPLFNLTQYEEILPDIDGLDEKKFVLA